MRAGHVRQRRRPGAPNRIVEEVRIHGRAPERRERDVVARNAAAVPRRRLELAGRVGLVVARPAGFEQKPAGQRGGGLAFGGVVVSVARLWVSERFLWV